MYRIPSEVDQIGLTKAFFHRFVIKEGSNNGNVKGKLHYFVTKSKSTTCVYFETQIWVVIDTCYDEKQESYSVWFWCKEL